MGKASVTPLHLVQRNHRASRVTTGRNLFVEVGDARSAWAMRWKDLTLAHASDLGGPESLSEAQISLIRRASAIECELEGMEGRQQANTSMSVNTRGLRASCAGCSS